MKVAGAAHQGDGSVSLTATLDARRTLLSLCLEPEVPECESLIGRVAAKGFRGSVDEICNRDTLAWVLLNELPVIALLSGYGTLYSGQLATPLAADFIDGLPVDICAGWAESGSMMVHIRSHREVPTPDGPEAPSNSTGWHAMPELSTGTLRRQRIIERRGNQIWAMFRDSYARGDQSTAVLHEYTLDATLEPGTEYSGDLGAESERITTCVATPRVLPWGECPGAAKSADRLVGHRLRDVAELVRRDLVGTTTCTHLNDILSSLPQAEQLV